MLDKLSNLPLRIKLIFGLIIVLLLSLFFSYRLTDITDAQPYPKTKDYETRRDNPEITFTTTDDSNKILNFYNDVFGTASLVSNGGVSSISVGKERYEVTEIDYYQSWILFHRDVRIVVYPTDENGVNQVLIRAY